MKKKEKKPTEKQINANLRIKLLEANSENESMKMRLCASASEKADVLRRLDLAGKEEGDLRDKLVESELHVQTLKNALSESNKTIAELFSNGLKSLETMFKYAKQIKSQRNTIRTLLVVIGLLTLGMIAVSFMK